MEGQRVCREHGGATPKGIASPHFKTGRHSKYMPVGLLDTYNELVSDQEKLALDHEIALVDTYISQIVEDLGDYSSAELWTQLQDQVRDYHKAPEAEKHGLLTYILDSIEAGASYVSKWDTLQKAMEQRRKLVADERKRRIEAEQVIEAEKALAIMTGLLESVRQNVHDRDTLNAIQVDFIRLVGANSQRRIDATTDD